MGPDPGDEFGDAGGRVGEAAAQRGGADVDVEVVLGDIDADEGAWHEGDPGRRKERREPTTFLFWLVNAELRSGDYSN